MRRPVPPHAYFAGSAVFHYLGPSFAVLLFARVDVLGVAWLRIASAALVLAAWRRPWRLFGCIEPHDRWLIAGLGGVFAAMNACFYRQSTGCRWPPSPRSSSSGRSCSPWPERGRRRTSAPWRR